MKWKLSNIFFRNIFMFQVVDSDIQSKIGFHIPLRSHSFGHYLPQTSHQNSNSFRPNSIAILIFNIRLSSSICCRMFSSINSHDINSSKLSSLLSTQIQRRNQSSTVTNTWTGENKNKYPSLINRWNTFKAEKNPFHTLFVLLLFD